MGKGFYLPSTRTFNLYVSFRYNASGDLMRWQAWFTWASEMLSLATEGRFRIGRVVYVNNETSGNVLDADLRILDGSAAETLDQFGFGVPGALMRIGTSRLGQPGVLVHELGHYAFGLWDEYEGGGCLPANTFGCVMQQGANSIQLPLDELPRWHPDNVVTEFCTDNHPTFPHRTSVPKTSQEVEEGRSCWESIDRVNLYGAISRPPSAPAPPDTTDVPDPVPIPMVAAAPIHRFVLLLDRSGSMAANDAIDGVRYAAHFWINLESMLGNNKLAVVSYASNPAENVALDAVPLPPSIGHTQAHTNVDNALQNPNGSTNITAALAFGEGLFTGSPAGDVMVLFSDGLHNVGPGPSMDTLTAADTTIYTFSFGTSANRQQMFAIANATGGVTRHILQPANSDHTSFEINKHLSEIAAISHSDKIAAADAMLLSAPDDGVTADVREEPGAPKSLEIIAELTTEEVDKAANMSELEVFVEEGTQQVTFVANYLTGNSVFLYVLDPDDTPLEPVTGQFAARDGHVTYTVAPRKFGMWRMRVLRLDFRDPQPIPVRMFAFAENSELSVVVFGPERLYVRNENVVIRAVAHYPGTLTNVQVRIWPEGDSRPDDPVDELAPGLGQYQLDLGSFPSAGSYPYIIEFRGDDDTIESVRTLAEQEEGDLPERRLTGPWVRRVDRQIHVGPLPTGEDNDGDDLPPGCCGALIRLLLKVCDRAGNTYRRARSMIDQRRRTAVDRSGQAPL